MRYRIVFILTFLLLPLGLQAQKDSLQNLWSDARLSGQIRHFWMSTVNQGALKDYAAAAIGGKIGLQSGNYKGFSAAAYLYSSFNLGITDLSDPDPTTGRLARYDLGLFDIHDPNKRFLYLLGEAYLQYADQQHQLRIGRMLYKTPMFNPQDGRMIPTLGEGLWYQNSSLKKWKLTTAYIQSVAVRSTSGWHSVENSLGLYPEGRNPSGTAGNYRGNTSSSGIFIQGVNFDNQRFLQAKAWNYTVTNVFNAFYADFQLKKKWSAQKSARLEAQYIWEVPLNNGGNPDPALAYFNPGFRTHVLGGRSTYQYGDYVFALAFNRILAGGQYLFPREWGRDVLYTFQKRERQDGQADTWALLAKLDYHGLQNLRIESGYGYYQHREPEEAFFNKYAMPSYHQINLDVFFDVTPKLEAEFLLAYKIGTENSYENPNFVINKVNMANINLILNYDF
jgi:hypothetical protein